MDLNDFYYRAFKEYRKVTQDSSACERENGAVAQADKSNDKLQSTKYSVTVCEDWIAAIEEGLSFVADALAEQRQFIRTEGEVVPIEKVKRVSKDSVEHLAKHSNLITHLPDGNSKSGILPDKLYMAEKLSDYAVYENKFLYMMLCYLKDFIEYRLQKIDELRRTYVGELKIDKSVVSSKRTLKIEARVYDERKDNVYDSDSGELGKIVKRANDCRDLITSFLSTGLMSEVAKTPMLKPPVVKTNVLKQNYNFVKALECYDYISSYTGDGYTVEEIKESFAPFPENLAKEIAESLNLLTFLSYKTGNKAEGLLECRYLEEEERRSAEEKKKRELRLERLKMRAKESDLSLEEYALALEEKSRRIERDCEELASLKIRVAELNKKIDGVYAEIAALNAAADGLRQTIYEREAEISRLNRKYADDIAAVKDEYEKKIVSITESHSAELQEAKAQFADNLAEVIQNYEDRLSEMKQQVNDTNYNYQQTVAETERRIAEMQRYVDDYDNRRQRLADEFAAKLKEAEKSCAEAIGLEHLKLEEERISHAETVDKLTEEVALLRGELDGIRAKDGKLTPSVDYTSRERFIELEAEYEAFQSFFKQQWEFTKKEIRKTILWEKGEKKKPIGD